MSKNFALKVAGIIFGIVALAHLLRVLFHFDIIISGYSIPMNLSIVALIVAFILCIWMLMASRK